MACRRAELAAERIDARARGENFPVASLLAPRAARPHLRAIYGFARLVDNLGDEAPGDRHALLDELERELEGPPRTEIMRRLHATIDACASAARALPPADPGEPDRPGAEPLRDLGGRARVLHVLGRAGRAPRPRRLRPRGRAGARRRSDDVCTGLQLVNFLQDPPRDLALGRVYLPLEDLRRFGVAEEELAGPLTRPRRGAACASRPRAHGRCSSAGSRSPTRSAGGRACSVALYARGGLAALRGSRARRLGRLHRPSGARRARPSPGWPPSSSWPPVTRPRRLRGGRAHHAARGAQLRLGDQAPAAGEAAGGRRAVRVRAAGRRHRRRRRCSSRRSAAGGSRPAETRSRRSRTRPTATLCSSRSPMPWRRYPDPEERAPRPRRRRAHGRRAEPLRERGRSCASTAAASPARSGSRARPCTGPATPTPPRRAPRRWARAPADQHHARRGRGLGASAACTSRRTSSSASASRRTTSPPAASGPAWRALMGHQAERARGAPAGGPRPASAPRPAQRPLRARLRGDLPRPASSQMRDAGLRRLHRAPEPLGAGKLRAVAAL